MGRKSERRDQRVAAAKARDFAAQAPQAADAARQPRVEVASTGKCTQSIPRSHAMAAFLLALGIGAE